MLVAFLAISLLPAVPATALTFLGRWRVRQSRHNGAPKAQIGKDVFRLGRLMINMRSKFGKVARNKVTATRKFRITSRKEVVRFKQAFETLLSDASMSVKVRIRGLSPKAKKEVRFPNVLARVAGPFRQLSQLVQYNRQFTRGLRKGKYQLQIRVVYRNGRRGFWDNNSRDAGGTGSPMSFALTGV